MATEVPELDGRVVITVTELATLLNLDPRTIRRGVADGSIPSVRVGSSVRIPVAKVRALMGLDNPVPDASCD